MGALASIRSRDTNSPDFQVSKKRRYSFMSRIGKETVDSTNSTVSRISQYPETSSKIHREVHAPCRTSKFGLGRSKPLNSRRESFTAAGDDMGSYLSKKLDLAKTRAMHALRFLPVRKDIVKEDEDEDKEEDSVREVVVIEDDGKEGRSIVLLDDDENEGETDRGNEDVSYDKNLVENAGKMLGSLELNQDVDASNVQVYKKLLEDVERRSGRKLKDLKFEIELNERKRSSFKSLRSVKKPEKSVEEDHGEPFIPLTEEEKAEVDQAVLPSNRKRLFVSHSSGIDITGEILRCLLPGAWLNDEVINLYLELLKEREKREPQKYLKCHFFSTFFYKKLVGAQKVYDYKAVRRWTTERKLGYFLIDCDKIFVPVHREIHWCLAIINKKDQKFQYLDSLKGRDFKVLKNLAKYYVEEVKEKSKIDIDVSDWEHEFVEDLPEQQNGYDCGMFMLKYIDFYSRGLGLCFGQEHMPYFRLRTAKEILRLRAD